MNVAFIPVRGGSKSIPLKNIKMLCGKPLVYWSVLAAYECDRIDYVYVATDSNEIRATLCQYLSDEMKRKVMIIDRSPESATDEASTEQAMLEFAAKYEFDNIVLIQATSPMIQAKDLVGGFELFNQEETDSVLSVVRQYRFLWKTDERGFSHPKNYDVFQRPRRQEFEGDLMENGAFYITSKLALEESGNRVSGNIKAYEMENDSAVELDESLDWIIIEHLMKERLDRANRQRLNIKMVLSDCDGCLTDGGMYYSENGDELKKFNTKDGKGFELLREAGIITGIITSENVDLNRRRVEKLQLDIYEPKCKDKLSKLKEICEKYHVGMEEIAYIGDDINDLDVIRHVGLGVAPFDAVKCVREAAAYVTNANGGAGVLREVADFILQDCE